MFNWTAFIEQVSQSSIIEWLAVISSVLYVILATKNNIFCWFFALVSSGLYMYICFDFQLYIESGLQLFYFAMAIIGWVFWSRSNDVGPAIQTWSYGLHTLNIAISGICTFLLGYFFATYTDQASPYVDAFTTCFSLAATYMVTKRILENWIYWIIIDLISIFLYSERELYLTSILYLLFTLLAVIGFMSWQKKLKRQSI